MCYAQVILFKKAKCFFLWRRLIRLPLMGLSATSPGALPWIVEILPTRRAPDIGFACFSEKDTQSRRYREASGNRERACLQTLPSTNLASLPYDHCNRQGDLDQSYNFLSVDRPIWSLKFLCTVEVIKTGRQILVSPGLRLIYRATAPRLEVAWQPRSRSKRSLTRSYQTKEFYLI